LNNLFIANFVAQSVPVSGVGPGAVRGDRLPNKKYWDLCVYFSVYACACFILLSESVVILTEFLHVFFYAYVASSIETCLNE